MKSKKEKRKKTVWDYLFLIILLIIILIIPFFIRELFKYEEAVEEYNSIPEMSDIPATEDLEILEVPPELWPDDSLFVEKERSEYRSGQLRLVIPRMEVDDDVMDGTDMAALKHGPGLYTVAQMPGKNRNSNTSIAAHRSGYGRYGNLFKEIHTVGTGDLLYLTDREWIFVYLYHDTQVTTPDDVSVLYVKEFPCLTLTSCHPLGKNYERIILTARMVAIYPFDEAYDYKMTASDEELKYYEASPSVAIEP